MARLSTFQSSPKGSKMGNLYVFDHLGLFWVRLDTFGPFQTKNDFLLKSTSAKPYFVLMQQIDFLSEMVRKCPDGPKRFQVVKNTYLGLPYRTF